MKTLVKVFLVLNIISAVLNITVAFLAWFHLANLIIGISNIATAFLMYFVLQIIKADE